MVDDAAGEDDAATGEVGDVFAGKTGMTRTGGETGFAITTSFLTGVDDLEERVDISNKRMRKQ